MRNDFFRAVAASPKVTVADVDANVDAILEILSEVRELWPDMVVFPELSLTAYTCGDLFHNTELLESAKRGLRRLVDECPADIPLILVGMPVESGGVLYNCAVGIARGRVLGVVPKTYLPNYSEFYERRWFAPTRFDETREADFGEGLTAPMSANILFDVDGVKVGVEICEDLWATIPPGSYKALNGAEVMANLSASDDKIGKYSYLKSLISQQAARCLSAYVYASAGYGESTTDLVFKGKCIINENGHTLAEADRFRRGNKFSVADIDIAALRYDRRHITTFADCAAENSREMTVVKAPAATQPALNPADLLRQVSPTPFIPGNGEMAEDCEEIIQLQSGGLARRLEAARCRHAVIGISGGLDSTLALLVTVAAFDSLGYDRKGIIGITMPGFGTTARTRTNAHILMEQLGITVREIPISEAVEIHFRDIGHDPKVTDVTYENSQARERTQILMDVANQCGGLVVGTGDLSELALGWATYNGDQMSMYGVNCSVPKTLIRHLVSHIASKVDNPVCRQALEDIINTPISPELIPADSEDNIAQKTEDLVGPYELHDFFIYRMLRFGETPERIFFMARKAFAGKYPDDIIKKWLNTFLRRFFAQQFKRSAMPDGPKVGSISLSPRGDWRMPSDASSTAWTRW